MLVPIENELVPNFRSSLNFLPNNFLVKHSWSAYDTHLTGLLWKLQGCHFEFLFWFVWMWKKGNVNVKRKLIVLTSIKIPSSSSSIIFFPCSNTQCAIDAQEKICSVWPSSVERDMVIGQKNWWPFSVARTGSFLQRYQYSRKVTWNVSRKMDLLKGPVTTPTKKLDLEGSQQHNCNSQNW